jgi:transcription-repair coupling factor (superfamily II helicase)
LQELYKPGKLIYGLTNSAKSLLLANLLSKSNKPIVFISQNHHEAATYYREIKNLCPSKKIFNFLAQEVSPYDQISSDVSVLNAEYEIFESWAKLESSLTIVNVKALSQLYINSTEFKDSKVTLKANQSIEPLELARKLILLGYLKEAMVDNRGTFSARGDIVDIYPIVGEPVRIEFFGDQIENIRSFNTSTQRSIKKIDEALIHPRFSLVRKDNDDLHQKIISKAQKYSLDKLVDHLQGNQDFDPGLYWEGIEYFRELAGQDASNIFEFMPSACHVVLDEWQDLFNQLEQWAKKQDQFYADAIKQSKLIPLDNLLHLDASSIAQKVKNCQLISYLQTVPESISAVEDNSYQFITYPAEKFASKVEAFVEFIKLKLKENQTIVIYSEQPQRVLGILKEWDVPGVYNPASNEVFNLDSFLADNQAKVIIQRDGLEEGCKLPLLDLVILTDRELFGRSRQAIAKQKNTQSTKTNKAIYTDISELKSGDYVVHYKHGIGIYRGTEFVTLDQGRLRQEYLVIEYADEARILLPVDQINLLSRFNVNQEVKPRLSKLGGNEWERTKKKVKKSVRIIAQDLINLYALREKQTGYKYPPDTPWQIEIEDAFAYQETEDQLKAIDDVKSDMETDKLVDRLICGDAGFGKTEVILRAVFKVLMEGRQVAILVPTTVLAQQHFDVFSDRYAAYPVRLGLLSRFRTSAEQREVTIKLKAGELDLVIGTHRLLQKDIVFKNLGLVVIDEEQRFGVAHKEKLKHLRKDLDVISMSATPIPRTLHMSLAGIRDISLITTPPTNRKPVKTFVGDYKTSIIRNAILHELERGGKVFFVHNKVEDIDRKAFEIQEIVPEANVRFAHGQMKDRELEDVMFSFVNGEFNVLVCTTIIETGLDISDANTIVINNANNFGLSQLYQLRGRVGRSDVQAYAYLLYNPANEISDTARERLKAIKELTNLGSGYQIALRDMEIRGVGNIFGAEQHGHMLSVGFDLYCKILSDTLEEMKGNADVIDPDTACTIDIKINAYFPETWITDAQQRINEYKRLSNASQEGIIDMLINEWQDRFGKLPQEAFLLTEIARLKLLASSVGIRAINQEGDFIRFSNDLRLQAWLQLQRLLPSELTGRATFKSGAVGARNAGSLLTFRLSGFDSATRLQLLRDIIELLKKHK